MTNKTLTRRGFIGKTGASGIGVSAGAWLAAASGGVARANPSQEHSNGWPDTFEPNSTAPVYPPRQGPGKGETVHEFKIDVNVTVHEILPKVQVHAFTYNGTLPGPELRVPEGDWVLVNLTNKTPEFHTIHWHGMILPNEMDGVPLGTQWPVGPGQTFRYLFRAQPAGTHFYHCHNMTPLHIQAGMFGALIIEAKDDIVKRTFPYTREYTLLLSEIDTRMVEMQMNEMLAMMQNMELMAQSPQTMKEMNGRMMGWFVDKKAFLKAIDDGYIPPYSEAMAGSVQMPNPNFFMINGKSYPMTDELMIRSGENIRVRLVGAGMMPHYMHLHGHDFWHVCQDGSPLAAPIKLNTIPVFPGSTSDIIIQGTNPGHWHFHDHSDISTTNNGQFPGGMMTMLMYEDMASFGVKVPNVIQVSS